MNPLVTVVTPIWNIVSLGRAESLFRCCNSVASLPEVVEHLLIDGGSNDGTDSLFPQFKMVSPRLVVRSEPDRGVYDAMNKGVQMARGKYIYFIGSDDYVLDRKAFSRAVSMIEEDNADMIVSPVRFSGRDGRESLPVSFKGLFCENPYPHQGVIMKTELVRSLGGFRLKYQIVADYDLILRAHLYGVKTSYLDAPYANYDGGGLSSNFGRTWRENLSVAADNFGLTSAERMYAEKKRVTPLRLSFRFMFFRDPVVRIAARHQLKRYVADKFGLLTANGELKSWIK